MGTGRRLLSAWPDLMTWSARPVSQNLDPAFNCVETNRTAVELFLEWLYSQQYPRDHRFGRDGENRKKQLRRLKRCVFGDRFSVPAFRAVSESSLIDSLVVAHRSPFYKAVIYAYEHLPAESPVFQALIDEHCYNTCKNSDTETNGELLLRSQLPKALLVGVMVRYMHLQPDRSERKRPNRCDYHGHTSDDEKGKGCKVPRVDDFTKKFASEPT